MNLPARLCAKKARGFTLLELLVAITVLSIVSIIAWRGLDSLVNTRARLDPEGDEIRALLTAFGQVERDLAHIATPTFFALPVPAVRVSIDSAGQGLELTRLAPARESEASAIQTVFYRVNDGALWRQATAPTRTLGNTEAQQLSNVKLLNDVKALRIRLWRDKQGWSDPAEWASSSPDAVGLPTGLEFTIERNNGRVYRRVVLVG